MEASSHVRRARAALLAGVCLGGVALAPAARADGISAEGAQQLEQQLKGWLGSLLGPLVPLGDRPIQVTAESDHYLMQVPFAGTFGTTGFTVAGDPVAAQVKPLDGGRWAIDGLRLPSPLKVTMPVPEKAGAAPIHTVVTIESQDQHAVFDPSLASPSRWDATLKGYKAITEGGPDGARQVTTAAEVVAHATWEPAPDGRLNIREESDSRLIASNGTMPEVGLVSFSAERMQGAVQLHGVAPDQVTPLLHAVMTLGMAGAEAAKPGPDAKSVKEQAEANRKVAEADRKEADDDAQAVAEGRMTEDEQKARIEERNARAHERRAAMHAAHAAKAAHSGFSPAQQKAAHDALVALADLISGFDEDVTVENLRVVAGENSGHLKKAAFGFSAGAPDGKVGMRLHIGLDGFESPSIPPGVYRDYLPRHVSLTPRVGGVPAADLRALLLRAADSQGQDPELQAQAEALLSKGPVAVGLDELALDFGPATLQGKGEVRISAPEPDKVEGEAHLQATGLDELIKQANAVPELAQAAPVLFMAKGMGRQEGKVTVWDITLRHGQVLVNGNDLSKMMGGGGGGGDGDGQ